MSSARAVVVSTLMPTWYDPAADDAAAAEAAIARTVAHHAARDVLCVELIDMTLSIDGPIWTWRVHLGELP